MLLDCLRLVVTNRNCTADRLISHWLYLTLLPQWVEIKHIDLFVRTIDEEKLMSAILNINLSNSEANMLRHLMDEFHLYHSPDLITLIAQNKLCNLLITHISWTVNFRAELPNLRDILRLVFSNSARFDESEICAGILEDAEAGSAWSPMSAHFNVGLAFQGDHRLCQHVGGFLPTKCVKWFVTVLLAVCSHNILVCFSRHRLLVLILFVLLSFKANDCRVEGLHKILNRVVDASIRERSCNHGEQVVDYHLCQVEDLRMLLVWSKQVPVKLRGEICGAPNCR